MFLTYLQQEVVENEVSVSEDSNSSFDSILDTSLELIQQSLQNDCTHSLNQDVSSSVHVVSQDDNHDVSSSVGHNVTQDSIETEPIDYTWEEGRDSHQFSDVEMHEPREIHFVEFKTQQSGKQNETVGKTKPIQKENIMEPALDRMSQHSEEEELDYYDDVYSEDSSYNGDCGSTSNDNEENYNPEENAGDSHNPADGITLKSPPRPTRVVTPFQMAGKFLNVTKPSTHLVPLRSDTSRVVSTSVGKCVTSSQTTHFSALSDYSKGEKTLGLTTERLKKYSESLQPWVKDRGPSTSLLPESGSASLPPLLGFAGNDGSTEGDNQPVQSVAAEPRPSCRQDVIAIKQYITSGSWQKFVDLYVKVTAHRRLLNRAEITDITTALIKKNSVNKGFAAFTGLLLSHAEVTRLDKQNISNIGVNILLAKESDTSAEDALSVLRTMIDKEIIFYDLSKSHSLSQARMVELAVKYLLDGANVDDRQHAVDLLNATKWPLFENSSYQVKLVQLLLDSAKDIKTLTLVVKSFRWLYTTYVNESQEGMEQTLVSFYEKISKAVQHVSQGRQQQCGNICIFLFKIHITKPHLFELKQYTFRVFFHCAYDSWQQKASDKLGTLFTMVNCHIYPQQPVWQLNNPCTRANGKPLRLWTCMSRKEIHVVILKFLDNMFQEMTYLMKENCRIEQSDYHVDIYIEKPPQALWTVFEFEDSRNCKAFRSVQDVLGEDLKPALQILRYEKGTITVERSSVQRYLRTLYSQRTATRQRPPVVAKKRTFPYQSHSSPSVKFRRIQASINTGPGILGAPPRELHPLTVRTEAPVLDSVRSPQKDQFQMGDHRLFIPDAGSSMAGRRPMGHSRLTGTLIQHRGRGVTCTTPPFTKSPKIEMIAGRATPMVGTEEPSVGRRGTVRMPRGLPLGRGGWLLRGGYNPRMLRGTRGFPNRGMLRGTRGIPNLGILGGTRGIPNPRMLRGSQSMTRGRVTWVGGWGKFK